MKKCNICENPSLFEVKFNNPFLRTDSYNKKIHNYKCFICENCGALNQYPQLSEIDLSNYYNSSYRKSGYQIKFENKLLDFPLKFSQTGESFQRFFYFYKMINEINFDLNNKTILDYGSYQGAFLFACKKLYNCKTIGYDHNLNGLNFAKNFLDIDQVFQTKDIYKDEFNQKIDLCSLIHTFEHIKKPNELLLHIDKKILSDDGLIYIEIPDLETCHFADPTHCFMYSIESLKYVLSKNKFEILKIEKNEFYGQKDFNTPRRYFQKNIHCIARKTLKTNYNLHPMQGKKIYNNTKLMHKKVFDKFILKKLIKIFSDITDILILFIARILFIFSGKHSVMFYDRFNKFKTKTIKLLKNELKFK